MVLRLRFGVATGRPDGIPLAVPTLGCGVRGVWRQDPGLPPEDL